MDLPTIEVLTDKNGLISVSTIDVADRQWALVVKPVQSIKYNRYQSIAWTVSFLLVAIMLLVVTSVYLRRRHIHTRREAHVRYQTLTQKLQAILDNTIDGIITIDSKGIIQSVNKAGLSMFGYSNDEMIGHNVSMITPEAIKMEHDSYIKNYLDGIPPKIIGIGRDVEGVRKDGSKIPLRLGVSQARVNGEIVFIGLLHDISERKNNEKMKDEFISTVNHELRTPLTSILGSMQLIRKVASEQVDESVRKLLKISENNTHRIIKIVNDILDLQKISSGGMYFDFLKIDLVSLAKNSIEECQPLASEQDIVLEFQPTSEAIHVTADKLRIEQVITNLLSNAIKFSPNNGKVTVRIEQAEGSDAIVFVEDEGPGIDNESKEKIFQPFTQTESHMTRKTSGTGLGLSISKSIIEKHSGTIGVNNRVKGGSCFYFTLPSAREAY
ncbi:sensor histidine kinase [Endozoicomonas atrinae]|uniref:sensor histidine kinase n=1 Tax=Endozoicomonas atrinae TaxID=1333660 RepID=UPI00082495A4|nr:PAS domain-containing sensor histidine kinase [Endozoicomonas atrinae]